MIEEINHICVCICTFKRPEYLKRLLRDLSEQDTEGIFTYSIVVVDNDGSESAKAVVSEFAAASPIAIRYCTEPKQNIALARNQAIANTEGNFVAFIDDDEFPTKHWLLTLFKTCQKYNVDGVLGPVKPHFDDDTPKWVVKGKFYDRPSHPTGFVIEWAMGRTGNVLLKKKIFEGVELPFRPQFLSGEDQDFFRRMIENGLVFIWCDEAVAYEYVPPLRWKRTFMLKRALLRGKARVFHPTYGVADIAKSVIAVPVYLVALPLALVLGQDKFMVVLVKLFDHLGKCLAALGINPIRDPYVTG